MYFPVGIHEPSTKYNTALKMLLKNVVPSIVTLAVPQYLARFRQFIGVIFDHRKYNQNIE